MLLITNIKIKKGTKTKTIATYHRHEDVVIFLHSQKVPILYPQIDDANFKSAFWAFKQQ